MASTYSQYKIELVGTGEQAGTWGTTTNNNFGSATPGTYQGFEQAIGGRADVTMSGTTTLSLTNSNAAQDARALYLNLSGTLSGAADLVVPALQKSYLVKNGTTGGFAVTIKVTGQTGVSIPNGKTVWVYNNGTDVVTAVDFIPEIATTTVDATNIEVTNIKAKDGTSAGSIADSTGVVTLASSVLTTTDINGGTIDGAVIGGASADAGSFTSLNTSGQVVFNDAGADVDFRVEGDTDVNLLFVDASADSVGIGTNAPSTILHINKASGETLVRTEVASGSEVGFDIVKTGATNQHWRIADGSVLNGTLEIYDVTNSRSNFRTSSTQSVFNESGADIDFRVEGDTDANLLFVDAGNDRVGIGTNEPGTRLEVGGADTVIRLRDSNGGVTDFGNDATGTYWRDYTNDTFRWLRTVGTETMRLTSDGYLRLAGGGIQFNGDTAAANALDDYEEGTWTAVITTTGGSTTIGSQTCTYTKVGRLVTLNGIIQVSGISSPTGQLTITGLPFTPAVANQGGSNVYMTGVAATSATSFFSEVGTAPRIYIAIYTELDNLADAAGLLTASSLFKFSAFYSV
jgi:hypothetical protein